MGAILVAAIGAFLILQPKSGGKDVSRATRLPRTLDSLYKAGQAAPIDPWNPSNDALMNAVCGAVTTATVKVTGGSDDLAAKAAGTSQYLANPVCALNVKAAQYGIQEGKQLLTSLEGGYKTVKGWFS